MIDVKELRIGNLINVNKHTFAVRCLDNCIAVVGVDKHFFPNDEALSGIALTPEILEKLPTWFRLNTFELRWNGNKTATIYAWSRGHSVFICDVEYLHELQNAVFALTGEELKIQL